MEENEIIKVLKEFSKKPLREISSFSKSYKNLVEIAPQIRDQELRRNILEMNEERIGSQKFEALAEKLKQKISARLETRRPTFSQSINGGANINTESDRDIQLGNNNER